MPDSELLVLLEKDNEKQLKVLDEGSFDNEEKSRYQAF
jgi:hypothetical protein